MPFLNTSIQVPFALAILKRPKISDLICTYLLKDSSSFYYFFLIKLYLEVSCRFFVNTWRFSPMKNLRAQNKAGVELRCLYSKLDH